MSFEGIFNQIFQPYFYYSVIFLLISFSCIKILARFCNFIGQRAKSLLYLIPLAVPLIVMLIFIPSTIIQLIQHTSASTNGGVGTVSAGLLSSHPSPVSVPLTISTTTILSITGLICLLGLVSGALFSLSMIFANDRLARKVLHVISLTENEYQWLQVKVTELCTKLAIPTPKIGVIDDLRPNAFAIGYGQRATIVFSSGLLDILNKEEVGAVASHELAHIKNHDFFFMTLLNALTAISFFNPFSYFASSTAQREREMLADEKAISLLEKPSVLGQALAKICATVQELRKDGMTVNFSSNLVVTSSLLHRVGLLSTHPRLDLRLRNISAQKIVGSRWNHRNIWLATFLSLILIVSAVGVSLTITTFQVNFAASQNHKPGQDSIKINDYNAGSGNGSLSTSSIVLPFNYTQNTPAIINHPQAIASDGSFQVENGNTTFITVPSSTP